MTARRIAPFAALFLAAAVPVLAQEATIVAPAGGAGSYDPTLSAKDAVLANWDLASAGLRAGRIVSSAVLAAAEEDTDFPALAEQARRSFDTTIMRYNASDWVNSGDTIASVDPMVVLAAYRAATSECTVGCAEERAELVRAFGALADEMENASTATSTAVDARKSELDRVLMVEQLTMMAHYLEGDGWHTDLPLAGTDLGRDELSARIVGVLALWRNIEPYIGLTDPEVDRAINVATDDLLLAMRRTRGDTALDMQSEGWTQVRAKADGLAAELRRAAGLFTS